MMFGGGGGDDADGFRLVNLFSMLQGDGGGDGSATLECSCGREFGEYMRQAVQAPFPWDPAGPVRRSVTTVWRGRRLRVLLEPGGEWHPGRVIKFEQYNNGPFHRETLWSVSVRFDDAAVPAQLTAPQPAATEAPRAETQGDERIFAHQTAEQAKGTIYSLSYRELQSSLKEMGLSARGRKEVLADRMYEAWLEDAEAEWEEQDLAAATSAAAEQEAAAEVERTAAATEAVAARSRSRSPSPSPRGKPIPPVDFQLIRANVHVGGTLTDPRPDKGGLLLSFEWLDAPVPDLSLGDGVSCPTCRQVQPPTAGEDVAPEATCVGDCPICLSEAQDCLKLHCGHVVCLSCWKKWEFVGTLAGEGTDEDDRGPDEPDGSELSHEALEAERKRLYDEMARRTREAEHTDGGQTVGDCPHCTRLTDMVNETIARMEDDDSGSRNGLRRHRRRLLTEPIITSMSDHLRGLALRYGSIGVLQVFVEVIPLREACIAAEIERNRDGSQPPKLDEQGRTRVVNSWMKSFCCRIGELYEEQGKYSSAIPWYKRCCSISALCQWESGEHSSDLSNLGVAQKRAGLFVEALASYDKAIALHPGNCDIAVANRQTLVREMRHWTGTAIEYDFDDEVEDGIRERLNAASPPYEQLPFGYYSKEQERALPHHRLQAASAMKGTHLLLWKVVKRVTHRIPPRVIQFTATAGAVILVVGLVMCIVVRSVDVFVFNEWSVSRAIFTSTVVTGALDPCSFDCALSIYCGLPSVRNRIDMTHLTEVHNVVAAMKISIWLLHVVLPLCLHCMQVIAIFFGSPHFFSVHHILVMANFGAVLAFCVAMVRLAVQTPWRLAAGAHAVAGALVIFLLMKCEGDILMGTPTLACGSESGGEDAPGSCVALLTGANSGIGYATAYSLAAQGHTVLLACRSQVRCDAAASSIVAALGSSTEERVVSLGGLELSSLTRVEEWVASQETTLPRIDVLFLNAGFLPRPGEQTEEGYEAGLGAMHFGHWALVEGLCTGRMLAPVSPRVVVISSDAHRMGSFHSSLLQGSGEGDLRGELTAGCPGDPGQPVCAQMQYSDHGSLSQEMPTKLVGGGAYARAKLANLLYARQLPVAHNGWRATSVHPGMVYTPMAERIARPYAWMQFGMQGAQQLFMRAMLRPASAAAAVVLHAAKSLEGNSAANRHFVNGMVRPLQSLQRPVVAGCSLVCDLTSPRALQLVTQSGRGSRRRWRHAAGLGARRRRCRPTLGGK
eukprot:COSAG02_NODE_6_length_64796_cov_76.792865_2_plen_1237_part_00